MTRAELEQVRAALAATIENMERFHPNSCKSWDNSRANRCDCGIEDRETRAQAALDLLDAELAKPEAREWGTRYIY